MKTLYLNDVLKEISSFLVNETRNYLIKGVETNPEYLRSNKILFLRKNDKELNLSEFDKYKEFTIVMQDSSKESLELYDKFIIVKVKDIEIAYWKFVKFYRSFFNIPVYGVTGTCGKSTVKEMLKYILSSKYKVQATKGSSNSNRLNLDYLLGIDDDTEAAVFELGVMFPDDILDYCNYFQPTIGIITNIGVDHLYFCENFQNYFNAKVQLLKGLNYQGALILNADDKNISNIDLAPYKGNIMYFGKEAKSHFKISDIKYAKNGMDFILEFKCKSYKLFVPGYGEHNVYNAVAAIAGANEVGISIEESSKILKSFTHLENHLQVFNGIQGCTVFDDTWSANPMSFDRAIKVLQDLGENKKKIAVFGRMSWQLGDIATEEYKKIGKIIVDRNIDILITRGELAQVISKSALGNGMEDTNVFICNNSEEVVNAFKSIVDCNSLVLVKASWGDDFKEILENIILR